MRRRLADAGLEVTIPALSQEATVGGVVSVVSCARGIVHEVVVVDGADRRTAPPSELRQQVRRSSRRRRSPSTAQPRPTARAEAAEGRVTELVARPLISLFWPKLAGVAQPLAGEYAGRRGVLERLPFPTGYGVELALLLDVAARHGVDAIAQVELGTRDHSHQPLSALGRMAAEVLHAAALRLELEGRVPAHHLLRPSPVGGCDAEELRVLERPPLVGDA